MLRGVVVGGVALQGTNDLVIDGPVDVVRLPVNLVCVPVLTGVRQVSGLVAVVVCIRVSLGALLKIEF